MLKHQHAVVFFVCLYRTSAGQEPIYFPAMGEDWRLQEILLPGQVVYLHSNYVKLLSELLKKDRHAHDMLRGFLAMQLDVQMRPIPGSGPLKQALKQGRWRPFLLMLGDEWRHYGPSQQQQLAARLKDLTVGILAVVQAAGSGNWLLLDVGLVMWQPRRQRLLHGHMQQGEASTCPVFEGVQDVFHVLSVRRSRQAVDPGCCSSASCPEAVSTRVSCCS